MRNQRGVTTVEFAIIGTLFFIVLFGVIEFGRLLFVWNTLTEASRRGARVAVVCPLNHPAIKNIAVFNNATTSGASPVLSGLDTSAVIPQYYAQDGVTETADLNAIRYVRVTITGYQHTLLIPFFVQSFTTPDVATTLPRESLGLVPDPDSAPGTPVPSQCFGT